MNFQVPPGACGTHVHFYEANAAVPPGTFMPGVFTVEDYRKAVQRRLGLERVIVVQANAYRDDHGGTLGFDVMDEVLARVHPFGWHANIQLDGRQLPNWAPDEKARKRILADNPAELYGF